MSEATKQKAYDTAELQKESRYGPGYKWIVLSNTTLGALMASIDGSILIISLPAIFNGLGVNPLAPANSDLLLWLLLGYTIVSAVAVVTIGRLSDIFGRVRLYNLGFLIFAVASTLIYASSYLVHGSAGAVALILLRLVQGVGGGFLIANSAAILTDAFPANERGKAMGINQIAAIGGSLAGLMIGGILAAIDWHLIFLISVPVGVLGTIWAYLQLHELATIKKKQRIDVTGNVLFAAAIACVVLSLTYGILPYGSSTTGFANPVVQLGLVAGAALLAAFIYVERHAIDPMLQFSLFKIRAFAAGCASMLLAGIARGGMQFMLIIWLQGIWLPLHGISFENTPLQAAIAITPMIVGFLLAGPVSGYLSDKYGARLFTTAGMAINAIGFLFLAVLPVNFGYIYFSAIIFMLGIGQGMFAAPNTASIMNAVPAENRGVASGIRATIFTLSSVLSISIFFSLLTVGVSLTLPHTLYNGLVAEQVPSATATQISQLPPTAALFAALLGDNPMKALLPANALAEVPVANQDVILGNNFFPNLIAQPFINGMRTVLYAAAVMTALAGILSLFRGKSYVYGQSVKN